MKTNEYRHVQLARMPSPIRAPFLRRSWNGSARGGRRLGSGSSISMARLSAAGTAAWRESKRLARCSQQVVLPPSSSMSGRFHRDRPGDSFGAWLRTSRGIGSAIIFASGRVALSRTAAPGLCLLMTLQAERISCAPPIRREAVSRQLLQLVRAEFRDRVGRLLADCRGRPFARRGRRGVEHEPAGGLQGQIAGLRRLRQELGGLGSGGDSIRHTPCTRFQRHTGVPDTLNAVWAVPLGL